jgi:hypothetical protein
MAMKLISHKTILRRVQEEMAMIRKLDPENCDPEIFDRYQRKARTIGYLATVASSVIKQHEIEERLDAIEKRLENETN